MRRTNKVEKKNHIISVNHGEDNPIEMDDFSLYFFIVLNYMCFILSLFSNFYFYDDKKILGDPTYLFFPLLVDLPTTTSIIKYFHHQFGELPFLINANKRPIKKRVLEKISDDVCFLRA